MALALRLVHDGLVCLPVCGSQHQPYWYRMYWACSIHISLRIWILKHCARTLQHSASDKWAMQTSCMMSWGRRLRGALRGAGAGRWHCWSHVQDRCRAGQVVSRWQQVAAASLLASFRLKWLGS
jgi:hypothetical protein